MTEQKKHSFLMAALENGEAFIDLLTENEAVKAVPILSTAVRLLEGADDIRSKLLRAKLTKFLSEPALVQTAESAEFRGRLLQEDEEAGSIGETLFMVLEKVTDLRKPELLAKAFAHYLGGLMSRNEMLLLSHAIDVGSIVDIQEFLRTRRPGDMNAGWSERLATVGLLKATVHSPMEGVAYFVYTISPIGQHLLDAVDGAAQP